MSEPTWTCADALETKRQRDELLEFVENAVVSRWYDKKKAEELVNRCKLPPMCDAPHPSEFIFEELTARGWTVDELAEKIGHNPLDMYLAVGSDEPGIRLADMADGLARAFGTSPDLWRNLEAAWLRAKGVEE